MLSKKPSVAVFFGGENGSNDLSEESGYFACQYIPRSVYRVTPVRVLPNGNWQVPLGSLPDAGPIKKMMSNLFSVLPGLAPMKGLERLLARPINALITFIRGRGGDDGSLQGLGSALSIPVVGPKMSVCQQTSDKFILHKQVRDIMPGPMTFKFKKSEPLERAMDKVRRSMVPPLFVKPVWQEVSIGVEEVNSLDELNAAIHHAQQTGDVLVQSKARGEEISLTLYDDAAGRVHTLPPTFITPLKTTFFDHLAKRKPGRVMLNTARENLSPAMSKVKEKAEAMYQELGCNGIISFDMTFNQDLATILEVNAIPTLSRFTPLLRQLKAQGMSPTQLLDQQIRQALL